MGQDIKEVWKLERNGENESQVIETASHAVVVETKISPGGFTAEKTKVMAIAAVPPVSTEEHRRWVCSHSVRAASVM